MKYQILDTDRS